MANTLERQITHEGQRNVIVKFSGIVDSGDFSWVPALALADCVNNDPRSTLSGFRLDLIEWSISQGMEIQVMWDASVPQPLVPIAGRGRIAADNYGGFLPNQARAGYTGSINLVSNGYPAGTVANFTVVLELVKLYKV